MSCGECGTRAGAGYELSRSNIQIMITLCSVNSEANRRASFISAMLQLWLYVEHFHPDAENLDTWRIALDDTLTKIGKSTDTDEFAKLIDRMLAYLNDPVTRLLPGDGPLECASEIEHAETVQLLAKDVVLVNSGVLCPRCQGQNVVAQALNNLSNQVLLSEKVIFDLRPRCPGSASIVAKMIDESQLSASLCSDKVLTPTQVIRYYCGPRSDKGRSSDSFCHFKMALPQKSFEPLPNTRSKRIVFLIDKYTRLPDIAIALQFSNSAFILSDGPIRADVGNHAQQLNIDGIGVVDVRLSEFFWDHTYVGGFAPTEFVPFEQLIERAIEIFDNSDASIHSYKKVVQKKSPRPRIGKLMRDRVDRILAAGRIWFFVEFFYPYKSLLHENWAQLLIDSIDSFESSEDCRVYALQVAKLSAHISDSHVRVQCSSLNEAFGTHSPGIRARIIENKPVITWLTPSTAQAGFAVGDELISINGETIEMRMARLQPYISSSTPQSANLQAVAASLTGTAGSPCAIEAFDGTRTKYATLSFEYPCESPFNTDRTGPAICMLQENIGYVDLCLLSPGDVSAMFRQLQKTRALIFDVRGYPKATYWSISSRLVREDRVGTISKHGTFLLTDIPAARFSCRINPVLIRHELDQFEQIVMVPWSNSPKYLGPTALLIDERTISKGEHTGMFFKAANQTTFIGGPSAGANGDVTSFRLPGGVRIHATAQGVEFPNGARLQRTGLVPDILIHPSIAAIKFGIDEQLNSAIEYLSNILVSR